MSSISRTALLQDFERLGRETAAVTVLFHNVVSQHTGLSPVELKCIDVISRNGPLTAGDIAAHTHLTSGAVTNLIDRLVDRGILSRTPDDKDRRKIRIALNHNVFSKDIAPLYSSLCASFQDLLVNYNDRDLQLIHEFMTNLITMVHGETTKLTEKNLIN